MASVIWNSNGLGMRTGSSPSPPTPNEKWLFKKADMEAANWTALREILDHIDRMTRIA